MRTTRRQLICSMPPRWAVLERWAEVTSAACRPGAQADIVVFDLQGAHLGPFFDPFKNLVLAGRGTDCRASYIAGRCVMEDFAVVGVDAAALQTQADQQFRKLMDSHHARAFGNPPPESLFHPVFPWVA